MKGEPFRAWQPLTFGGVARFAHDWIGRLFLIGVIIALLATISVVQTARRAWQPVIESAITRLPNGAEIRSGRFTAEESALLAENTFLAIRLDPLGNLQTHSPADLEVTFEPSHLRIRSIFGSNFIPYEPQWTLLLNRPDMESWWGAWKPAVVGYLSFGTIAFVIVSWFALGIPYALISFIAAVIMRRQVTPWGTYKLSIAALMPGALLFSVGIVLYGLSQLRLTDLLGIWIAHFVVGWIFVAGALPRLPKRELGNPFQTEREEDVEESDQKSVPKKRNRGGPPSS